MSCEKWCTQVTMAPIRIENISNVAEYLLVPLSKQSLHPEAATFWFLPPEISSSCSWTSYKWNLIEWTLFILTSLIQCGFKIHLYCCINYFFFFFCWVVFHCMNMPQFTYPSSHCWALRSSLPQGLAFMY